MAYRSKYQNKKVTVNGETFDSQKEYRRFCELSLLEKAGKIHGLQRQVKYVLIPAQYDKVFNPKRRRWEDKCIERECSYMADFRYFEDGKHIVEDTKGFRTKDYIIKRKLLLWVHGIRIKEV